MQYRTPSPFPGRFPPARGFLPNFRPIAKAHPMPLPLAADHRPPCIVRPLHGMPMGPPRAFAVNRPREMQTAEVLFDPPPGMDGSSEMDSPMHQGFAKEHLRESDNFVNMFPPKSVERQSPNNPQLPQSPVILPVRMPPPMDHLTLPPPGSMIPSPRPFIHPPPVMMPRPRPFPHLMPQPWPAAPDTFWPRPLLARPPLILPLLPQDHRLPFHPYGNPPADLLRSKAEADADWRQKGNTPMQAFAAHNDDSKFLEIDKRSDRILKHQEQLQPGKDAIRHNAALHAAMFPRPEFRADCNPEMLGRNDAVFQTQPQEVMKRALSGGSVPHEFPDPRRRYEVHTVGNSNPFQHEWGDPKMLMEGTQDLGFPTSFISKEEFARRPDRMAEDSFISMKTQSDAERRQFEFSHMPPHLQPQMGLPGDPFRPHGFGASPSNSANGTHNFMDVNDRSHPGNTPRVVMPDQAEPANHTARIFSDPLNAQDCSVPHNPWHHRVEADEGVGVQPSGNDGHRNMQPSFACHGPVEEHPGMKMAMRNGAGFEMPHQNSMMFPNKGGEMEEFHGGLMRGPYNPVDTTGQAAWESNLTKSEGAQGQTQRPMFLPGLPQGFMQENIMRGMMESFMSASASGRFGGPQDPNQLPQRNQPPTSNSVGYPVTSSQEDQHPRSSSDRNRCDEFSSVPVGSGFNMSLGTATNDSSQVSQGQEAPPNCDSRQHTPHFESSPSPTCQGLDPSFSWPLNVPAPAEEMSDNEILESLKKLYEELGRLPPHFLEPHFHNWAYRWYYVDLSGKLQGAYNTLVMLKWFVAGHFPPNTQLRREDESNFNPINNGVRLCATARMILGRAKMELATPHGSSDEPLPSSTIPTSSTSPIPVKRSPTINYFPNSTTTSANIPNSVVRGPLLSSGSSSGGGEGVTCHSGVIRQQNRLSQFRSQPYPEMFGVNHLTASKQTSLDAKIQEGRKALAPLFNSAQKQGLMTNRNKGLVPQVQRKSVF